jgi:WD40 repeat protein
LKSFHLVLKNIFRLLATGSADATIKIWSLTDHSCVKQLEGHDCSVLRLLWISESQVASSASDGLVKVLLILQTFGLWDVWSRWFLVFFFSLG